MNFYRYIQNICNGIIVYSQMIYSLYSVQNIDATNHFHFLSQTMKQGLNLDNTYYMYMNSNMKQAIASRGHTLLFF